MYELIRQALTKRLIVRAVYKGRHRAMCPHVLGLKNGQEHGLFYQFSGESGSGLQPDGSPANWRCIRIDALSDVTVHAGAWHTSSDYSQHTQTCVDRIDAAV